MKDYGTFEAKKIHLLRVEIIGASIENPLEIAGMNVDGFKFRLGFNLGFDTDEKMAKAELEINLSTDLNDTERQAKGKFQLAFIFVIDNFDEMVHVNESEMEIEASDDLAMAITSITYSTARGILLTRFQGTIFRDFILPILSPSEILNNEYLSEKGG